MKKNRNCNFLLTRVTNVAEGWRFIKTLNLEEILQNMNDYKEECKELELFSSTNTICLSKSKIIKIHDKGIDTFGGIYGVRDEGLLDSVSKAPYQSCFGSDLYPSVFDKAAKYLYDFSTYQVFLDGNKRVGLGASTMLLMANGYDLDMDYSEIYDLTMDIANGKLSDVSDVSKILESRSVELLNNKDVNTEREDV